MAMPGLDNFFNRSLIGDISDRAQNNNPGPFLSNNTKQIFITVCFYCLNIPVILCGYVFNAINMVVLIKMGFAETINISLLGLAVADFLFLCLSLISSLLKSPLVAILKLPIEPIEVVFLVAGLPNTCILRTAELIIAYISFERCLCVLFPLKFKTFLSPKMTLLFVSSAFVLPFAVSSPIYTVLRLGWKTYTDDNSTLLGLVAMDKNVYKVRGNSFAVHVTIGNFAFIVVILCTLLLTRQLQRSSKWRASVTKINDSPTQSSTAAKVSVKHRRVVSMVTVLSFTYIVCYVPNIVHLILVTSVREFNLYGRYHNSVACIIALWNLSISFNASINFLVYVKMSTKFRDTLFKFCRRKNPLLL